MAAIRKLLGSHGFSVSAKLMMIVGFCIFLTCVVAGYGVMQMSKIGSEIKSIAEEDLPLIKVVSQISTDQLEQTILLDRMLAAAGISTADRNNLGKMEEELKALGTKTEKVIENGEKVVDEAVAKAKADGDAKGVSELNSVLGKLRQIRSRHSSFDKQIDVVVEHIARGRIQEATEVAGKLEAEAKTLGHQAEGIMADIEKFTVDSADGAEADEKSALLMMSILSIISAMVGFGLAWWVMRVSVSRPLTEVVTALNRLSDGDTSVECQVRNDDEIGQVAKAFGVFKEKLLEMRRMEEEKAEAEKKAQEERRQATLKMADDLEATVKSVVDGLAAAATEMEASAKTVSSSSEETNAQATAVAAASEQASNNVQTVASAAEELSSSVNEISGQVANSNEISRKAVEETQRTNETVQGLAEAAQKIGDVVNLINDIASQTNLLALNATIEAARAGDAGKGFAVVASEVKSLATQTAQATDEIAAQISSMQNVTQDAVTAIQGISTTIEKINEIANSISAAVEEQGAATQEISRNVQEAAMGTSEVSKNISGVNTAASESSAAATQVVSVAGELSKQAEELRQELNKFLTGLRAA